MKCEATAWSRQSTERETHYRNPKLFSEVWVCMTSQEKDETNSVSLASPQGPISEAEGAHSDLNGFSLPPAMSPAGEKRKRVEPSVLHPAQEGGTLLAVNKGPQQTVSTMETELRRRNAGSRQASQATGRRRRGLLLPRPRQPPCSDCPCYMPRAHGLRGRGEVAQFSFLTGNGKENLLLPKT